MGWLGSSLKCSRQMYWIVSAALCVLPILVKVIHVDPLAMSGLWIVLYRFRLRDCGRTQWLVLGFILVQMLPFLIAGVIGGDSFVYAISHHGVDESGHRSLAFGGAIVGAFLIQFGFTVWLGVQEGKDETRVKGAPTSGEPSIWEARTWEDDEPGPAPAAPPSNGDRGEPRLTATYARPAFGRRSGS